MIFGFTLLLAFQIAGNVLERYFSLPIPGTVIGMFLLLTTLICNENLAKYVRPISLLLISYLAIFFVPAGVGVMLHLDRIQHEWIAICSSLVISTLLAIATTALVIKYSSHWLEKKRQKKLLERQGDH
ncbi:MAG: CidA/LrgA family protein [Burkholderiaceae bacterium]|nr:CidA/LrgA family protein [Burkholderiaceae bacterium]